MADVPHFDFDLSAGRVLCNFHPLPWKETWLEPGTQVVVITFILELFNALMADADFIAKCTLPGEDGASTSMAAKLMPIPLCCWVAAHHPDALEKAYKDAGVTSPDAGERARRN